MEKDDLKIEFRAVPYASNSRVLEYRISSEQDLTYYVEKSYLWGLIKFKCKRKYNTSWKRISIFKCGLTSHYYDINHSNTKEDNGRLRNLMINSDIAGKINMESLHRMFDGCPDVYNKEAYKFLMKYFNIILEDEKLQSLVPSILKLFNEIKLEYGITDGNIPTFNLLLFQNDI